MSAVSRVSIPNSVKRTIQNIKEIAGNHSDDEIYSALKDCSMDPNETAQKLLYQDTFHEVRRKRDKRKESNREASDANGRPGSQGRVSRTVRGNYGTRYASHAYSGAGRNLSDVKQNGIAQVRYKDVTSSHTPLNTTYKAVSPERRSTAYAMRSMDNLPIGLSKAEHLLADDPSLGVGLSAENTAFKSKKTESSLPKKLLAPSTYQVSSTISIVSSAAVNPSESEPGLIPSLGESLSASVGAVKQEENDDSIITQNVGGSELSFVIERVSFEKKDSVVKGRVHGSSLEVEGTQLPDAFQSAPSIAIVGNSSSRPSSNYGNRSQHASAPLKANLAMEWKPKSTNVNPAPCSEVCCTSGADLNKGKAREAVSCVLGASDLVGSDISKKVLNLENLRISDAQHVIIPDHLQVPEYEKIGLSFGSFGSNFGLDMGKNIEPEKIKYPEEPSALSKELEEDVEQLPSCSGDESPVAEENTYSDDQKSERPEDHPSILTNILSNVPPVADYDQSKAEVSLATEASQLSIIHTAPVYSNFGLVPQKIGSPFPPFDGADIHARDTGRIPGYVVPQPFDPSTNYYASFYRPTADGDGRFSPFLLPGVAPKYNGNIAIFPPQTSQSPQENGNSLVLSSSGPTPFVTTTGVLQNSVAASQQPIPVFRQPSGVHISHYPPNYNPYNQYFSPFYVPPPAAIHHFLGNAAIFPQQSPAGNLYPPPAAATGTSPVKYPISQYKAATNSGPTGQGTYGMNPAGYSSAVSPTGHGTYGMNPAGYSSAVSGGSSTCSEDLTSSQFKENYVFLTGQQNPQIQLNLQSEGSAVWIAPPGRDISTLQAGSFYNLPSHGQPVAFAPTQAGHAAAFTGLFHPNQSLATGSIHPMLQQSQAISGASEIAGSASVYQTPHRSSQINWVNNF